MDVATTDGAWVIDGDRSTSITVGGGGGGGGAADNASVVILYKAQLKEALML